MRRLLIAAAFALAAPAAAHAEADCADLSSIRLPHAEVTAAAEAKAGDVAVCRIAVTSRPTPDSDIRIEVMIPRGPAWNGKYVQVGNGGLAGSIPTAQIRARAAQGYAAAGTDDGHRSDSRSAAWALGHPEKIKDFAFRSLKETTETAKALIRAQKDGPAKLSYFVGCSAGGREALMEAQRYPADFDGIVAGAPANYNTLSTGGRAYIQQMLTRPGAYLDKAALQLLQDTALRQCGGEAFIRDQIACRFDPRVLTCRPGRNERCLSPAQVAAAQALYSGRPGPDGRSLFPAYTPGGEALPGGFQAWNTGPSQDRIHTASGYAISSQFLKYFVYDDQAFDFLKADLGPKYDRDRQKVAAILDAVDPDLSRFRRRGGKLIQWHGWNDPAIPPMGSVRYYQEVNRRMGRTDDFYRLYMLPGVLHCRGGAAPGDVDWLQVLEQWVEGGKAPGPLVATAGQRAPDDTAAAAKSQLVCPYPAVARHAGGDRGVAESWRCGAPGKRSQVKGREAQP
jgi:hypothetical protein